MSNAFRMAKYTILADTVLGFDPAAKFTENGSEDDFEARNATKDVIDTLVDSEKECFIEEEFLLIDKARLLKVEVDFS